ncbi:MAG: RNA polymerase sigma-70 factor (ECF subfamily) [Limisphaerales bacterium]|jgi:RNA polymerase sigma-70 factor (ECF subfamily)
MATNSEITGRTPTDETRLVREVQAGDLKAFEPLVDAHLDHLRAFIALRLPKPHLINEIAHEAFIFAFNNIGKFDAGSNFHAWLRAIAHNLVRAELQRFAREQQNQLNYATHRMLAEDLAAAPTSPTEVSPAIDHLKDCVDSLPEKLRQLVKLRYSEEVPVESIADRLERSQTNIWQMLFRLRKQLKQCVESKLKT